MKSGRGHVHPLRGFNDENPPTKNPPTWRFLGGWKTHYLIRFLVGIWGGILTLLMEGRKKGNLLNSTFGSKGGILSLKEDTKKETLDCLPRVMTKK